MFEITNQYRQLEANLRGSLLCFGIVLSFLSKYEAADENSLFSQLILVELCESQCRDQ